MFWGIALILLALVFVVYPLLRPVAIKTEVDRLAFNTQLFQDHLSEQKAALERGQITQSEFEAIEAELARSLIQDNQVSEHEIKRSSGKIFLLGTLVLLPLCSIFLYWHFGAYDLWEIKTKIDKLQSVQAENTEQYRANLLEVQNLLQKHVEKEPEDLRSRMLLAQAAIGMGNVGIAESNYRYVIEKQKVADASVYVDLADVILNKRTEESFLEGEELLDTALNIDPNNWKALSMKGTLAFYKRQPKLTLEYLRRALQNIPPAFQEERARLSDDIILLEAALAKLDSAGPKANTKPVITVDVKLGDGVDVPQDQVVFVYARAWQASPMPLAIKRLTVADLPATIELSDDLAMNPSFTLSSAQQVEIVARVSLSGQPKSQPGDWEASFGPVQTAEASKHELVIEQQLE